LLSAQVAYLLLKLPRGYGLQARVEGPSRRR
jgi:hypothetical protein